MDADQRRSLAAGSGQLPEGAFPGRAAARLGCFAAGAVFRLRDSRQPGQLLVRVVRRADRLHGVARGSGASARGERFERLVAAWSADVERRPGTSKFITSSARTSRISTRCSGRPCCKTAGFKLPTKVHIHGFLTVGGEKMSKSKGTFVRAATYLKHLESGVSALLLRHEARPAARRSRSEPRRVRHQGEFRPGRQGRQPGQPHGAVCRRDRSVGQRIPTTAGCSRPRPPKANRSPRRTKPATTTGPCGRSWCWPIGRINIVDAKAPWTLRKDSGRADELQRHLHDRAESCFGSW